MNRKMQELLKSHDNHVINVIARAIKVVHNASEMSGQRDKVSHSKPIVSQEKMYQNATLKAKMRLCFTVF